MVESDHRPSRRGPDLRRRDLVSGPGRVQHPPVAHRHRETARRVRVPVGRRWRSRADNPTPSRSAAGPPTPTRSAPTQVHVYVDGGAPAITTANIRARTSARPTRGSGQPRLQDVGPGQPSSAPVCVYAISVGNGGNRQLGCANLSGNTVGYLDDVDPTTRNRAFRGWAIDPDTTAPVPIHVYVDGVGASIGTANTDRPDIGNAIRSTATRTDSTWSCRSSGDHTVCAYAISTRGKPNITLGCTAPAGRRGDRSMGPGSPDGTLRGARLGASIRTRPRRSTCTCTSTASAGPSHAANTLRTDVGRVYGPWGDRHGFDFTVGAIAAGPHQVCVYAISVGGGGNATLGCKTIA